MAETVKIKSSILNMLELLAINRGLEMWCYFGGMARYVGASRKDLGRRSCASPNTIQSAVDAGLIALASSDGRCLSREYHYRITRKGRQLVKGRRR